jgi:Flp pilus assembly protein CpaB
MVTTRPVGEAGGPDGEVPAPARRRVERLRGLPGSRAVVGGLLVALAGVGTLVAWQQASGTPDRSYAVAARPILPGETVTAADVRLVPIDLPGGVAGAAFTRAGDVEGRVALGPLGEGELVQVGQLSDPGAAAPAAEVSLAVGRDRAVDGRLRSGDLVDLFVTYDERTEAVVEGVRVVGVTDGGAAAFSTGSDVTVTLALTDGSRRAAVIHAARAGEVTLVRSTHLAGVGEAEPFGPPAGAGTPGPPVPPGGGGEDMPGGSAGTDGSSGSGGSGGPAGTDGSGGSGGSGGDGSAEPGGGGTDG